MNKHKFITSSETAKVILVVVNIPIEAIYGSGSILMSWTQRYTQHNVDTHTTG